MTNKLYNDMASMMAGWKKYVHENGIHEPDMGDMVDYIIEAGVDESAYNKFFSENEDIILEARRKNKKKRKHGPSPKPKQQSQPISGDAKKTPDTTSTAEPEKSAGTTKPSEPEKPADAAKTTEPEKTPDTSGTEPKKSLSPDHDRRMRWYSRELSGFSKNELRAFISVLSKASG